MSPKFDPYPLRRLFPSLKIKVGDQPAAFLDGPGGTQTPQSVIDAVSSYYHHANSNLGGAFDTSQKTVQIVTEARQAMADLFNAARPEEIAFGQNMTSLTFAASRAISRTWNPGDEIVITRLDHDANITPWILAAKEREVSIRWWDIQNNDCTLNIGDLEQLLNDRTRLVAVTHASNAVGTIVDISRVCTRAHKAGALVYVDAVHYTPHSAIDVQGTQCDFLVASAYKFFGPHAGVFYGKYTLLESLEAYKVRPASDAPPGKWETGTQSFESLAGITAAVKYLADIGRQYGSQEGDVSWETGNRVQLLRSGMEVIKAYEEELSLFFLNGAATIPGLKVYGITDIEMLGERTPTFAVSLEGFKARQVAKALGDQGIFVWDGHYYAVAVMDKLGLLDSGGLVRIGMVHYNTFEEVERVVDALRSLARN
jgi:cysteine desulfurase family protein (TIGR01976 family)